MEIVCAIRMSMKNVKIAVTEVSKFRVKVSLDRHPSPHTSTRNNYAMIRLDERGWKGGDSNWARGFLGVCERNFNEKKR